MGRSNPVHIEVAPGSTITWTNDDPIPHDVKFDGGEQSPRLGAGQTWSTTLDAAGVYDYVCTLHPGMVGVTVAS